jgi:hypothetical protein
VADYSFEIKRADRILHVIERVPLTEPREAWGVIEDLALRFDGPGLRIIVKDEAGGVVIMAGLVSARNSLEKSAA